MSNSGITLFFLSLACFVMMCLWAIGFSVPMKELVPLQLDFPQSLLCLVLRPLILLLSRFFLAKISFRDCRRSHYVMILSILVLKSVPVAPRGKRHYILATGISTIVPESRKPNLPYEPCTANLGIKLLVKLLFPRAKKPTRGRETAAAYDLYCAEDITMINQSSNRKLVDTGLANAIPGTQLCTRIAPQSSLSIKDLDIEAGVEDANYRSSVKVLLIKSGDTPFQINPGD